MSEIQKQPYLRGIAPSSYYFNDSTNKRDNLELYGLLLETPCVFDELEIEGEDVLTEWNFNNKTITRDIFTKLGLKITSYKLQSGSLLELSY